MKIKNKIKNLNLSKAIKRCFLIYFFFIAVVTLPTTSTYANQGQPDFQKEKVTILKNIEKMSINKMESYCHNFLLKKNYDLSIFCYESSMEKFKNEINSSFPIIYVFLAYNYIMKGELKKAEELLSNYVLYSEFDGKEPVTREDKRIFEAIKLDVIIKEFLSADTKQSGEKAYEYALLFKKNFPDIKSKDYRSADIAIESHDYRQKMYNENQYRLNLSKQFFHKIEHAINNKDTTELYEVLKIHSSNQEVLEERFCYFRNEFMNTQNLKFIIYDIRRYHSASYRNIETWSLDYSYKDNTSNEKINTSNRKRNLVVTFNDKMVIQDWRK